MTSFHTTTTTTTTTSTSSSTETVSCHNTETPHEHTNDAAGSCLICGSRVHQTRNCPVSPRN
ncbi:hypothetical protein K501DRAFT_284320 [Backusella circina FSU 941]|nr:hypothetical protein K501DRAFT_284320 [Backusella circina FSU 941]